MTTVVWSKDSCTFCEQAKRLLTQQGIVFEERKIGHGWTREDLLKAAPAARTVPQIFINNQLVGGFNELKQRLKG